jgi:hypothetical protein
LLTKFINTLKRKYTITKLFSFQGDKDGSTYTNQKCNIAHEWKRDKIHIIISIDAGKA